MLIFFGCSQATAKAPLSFAIGGPYTQRAGAFYLHGTHPFNPGIMQEALYALTAHCLKADIKVPFDEIQFAVADSMTLAIPREGHKVGDHANALTYDQTDPILLVFRLDQVADVTSITHEFVHILKPEWKHWEKRFYKCIR